MKISILLGSISPTYLRKAFMSAAPKSVRICQVVSIFLRFWDLRAQKLLVERFTCAFLNEILAPKITKLCFGFEVLAPKISYERTTLMKLTPAFLRFM